VRKFVPGTINTHRSQLSDITMANVTFIFHRAESLCICSVYNLLSSGTHSHTMMHFALARDIRVPIPHESSNGNIVTISAVGEMLLHLIFSVTSRAATTTVFIMVEVSFPAWVIQRHSYSVQRLCNARLYYG
jgi:hypothetical protein